MTLSTLEELLSPVARRYDVVTLPISGRTLRIQSLTEEETQAFQLAGQGPDGKPNKARIADAQRRLFVLAVVDGDGRRLMNDTHLPTLAKWDNADSEHLYQKICAHAGLRERDVEALAKNFERTAAAG